MGEGVPAEVFQARRDRALDSLGQGAMVIPAGSILRSPGGSEVRFRPTSEFFYLTGILEPDAILLLRGFAEEDRTLLFVRPRDERWELWNGPRLGPEGVRERAGLDEARSLDDLPGALPDLLEGADLVHFRLGRHPEVEAGVGEALRRSRIRGARTGTGPRGVIDPGGVLDELRLRKDPAEIEALRAAAEVTVAGFRRGLARAGPGAGEWEVEAALEGEFRRLGSTGSAFPPIVGSGPNACTLHYVRNARRMREGELLLVDAGAEYRMYGGDITRTVPVSGRFSTAQRELYTLVEEARSAAVATIRPGVTVAAIHDRVVEVLVRGLVDLGVLRGDRDELIASEAHRPWFPHSTSHWLGLDTHDVGDYAVAGEPRPLEPGMVLTVEPGLYFPSAGESPFRGLGVRIEDDVLVTPEGSEVLTTALPTAPDEVEALVGEESR